MPYETIEVSVAERIGVLAFNRPHVLNAFNPQLVAETCEAMQALDADPAVLAIIVRGNGRAFSAGFDMKATAAMGPLAPDQWRRLLEQDFAFILQFWDSPKPTIAAVHGYCLAGAFELSLACDITVAAEGTLFGEPEVRFGSSPVALLLPWTTGPKQAKELLLTGADRITARRALSFGVINHVVPDGQELDKALAIARDIAAAAPQSVQLTKRAINRNYEAMGMRAALAAALETGLAIEVAAGPERTEFNRIRAEHGLKAALAWRDARFRT